MSLPTVVDFEFSPDWLRLELVTPEAVLVTIWLSLGDNPISGFRYKGIGHMDVGMDRVPEEYWLHIERKDGSPFLLSVAPENPSDFHKRFFMRPR